MFVVVPFSVERFPLVIAVVVANCAAARQRLIKNVSCPQKFVCFSVNQLKPKQVLVVNKCEK